jgi:hypothetical protein
MIVRRLKVQCFRLFDTSVDPIKIPHLTILAATRWLPQINPALPRKTPTLFSGRKRVHSPGESDMNRYFYWKGPS